MSSESMPTCEFDASRLKVKVDVIVPCDVEEVSPTVESIMRMVTAMECASGKEFEVETAIREALSNAIIRGVLSGVAEQPVACVLNLTRVPRFVLTEKQQPLISVQPAKERVLKGNLAQRETVSFL